MKQIFQLWKEANDAGLNNDGRQLDRDVHRRLRVFQSGKAAHVIGLMSDIGHWKDFNEFLGADNVGVMHGAGRHRRRHARACPYDGGIGYGVAKWTKDPKPWPPTWCGR